MRTSKDYKVHFKVANSDYGILTVPKGTRVTHMTATGIDKNYHFVDDFSWVPTDENGRKNCSILHDLKYYGINVPKEFIEDECISQEKKENDQYWRNGGHNGPTGHGDICFSDADPGL